MQKVGRGDWRVRAVVGAIFAVLVPTLVIYALGWGRDPSTHFGAIFASWVSGVALFMVAAVGTLASFARPELESFDARARILFRRQTGKHIDYIVTTVTEKLEHYTELTSIYVTIRDYQQSESKFRIVSSSDIILRSYLDDVRTTCSSAFILRDISPPPPDGLPNRLIYLKVDGEPVGKSEEFTTEISRPLSCSIDADTSCVISREAEHWLVADTESNIHKPKRYTQSLKLHFENLTSSGQDVALKFKCRGNNWETVQLPHGKKRIVLELKDIRPGEEAYDYRILKP